MFKWFESFLTPTAPPPPGHPPRLGWGARPPRDRINITLPADMDRRIGSLAVMRGARWAFLVDEQNHYSFFL